MAPRVKMVNWVSIGWRGGVYIRTATRMANTQKHFGIPGYVQSHLLQAVTGAASGVSISLPASLAQHRTFSTLLRDWSMTSDGSLPVPFRLFNVGNSILGLRYVHGPLGVHNQIHRAQPGPIDCYVLVVWNFEWRDTEISC